MGSALIQVSPEEAYKESAELWVRNPHATILYVGRPGLGKSMIPMDIGRKVLGCELFGNYNAGAGDGTDLSGIPMIIGSKCHLYRPDFLVSVLTSDRPAMMVVDEIFAASTLSQPALYGMFHEEERSVNGMKLGPNVYLCATSNTILDQAAVNAASSALLNRFTTRFHVKFDAYSLARFFMDKGLDELYSGAVFFIASQGGFEEACKPQTDPLVPFFSPRAFFSFCKNHANGVTSPHVLRGAVGEWTYQQFEMYLKNRKKLPKFSDIISNPESVSVDFSANMKYSIVGALARRATFSNFNNVARYAERLGGNSMVRLLLGYIEKIGASQSPYSTTDDPRSAPLFVKLVKENTK